MQVTRLSLEDAASEPDVREELDDLDTAFGSGGAAQAIRLGFFTKLKSGSEEFLGFADLINYQPPGVGWRNRQKHPEARSYIYQCVLRIPTIIDPDREDPLKAVEGLLNNYCHCSREFKVNVDGATRSVTGAYYCQQNNATSTCAQASLRMVINSGPLAGTTSTRQINATLGITVAPSKKPRGTGLLTDQLNLVAEASGYSMMRWNFFERPTEDYAQLLYSIVESHTPALLAFTTREGDAGHVVPVFGHTLNSDEWYPEARIAYSGPPGAKYHPSSSWVDHFLIHDDNFGPYYCLAPSALRKSVLPQIDSRMRVLDVVGLFPTGTTLDPFLAENIATVAMRTVMPHLLKSAGRWRSVLKKYTEGFGVKRNFVLRTFHMKRSSYRSHLLAHVDHSGGQTAAQQVSFVSQLPKDFWITEVSLPDLYTGNKTKLGEVLVRSRTRRGDQDVKRHPNLTPRRHEN
jgi:hypothetical protein